MQEEDPEPEQSCKSDTLQEYLLRRTSTVPISHARRGVRRDFPIAELLVKKNTSILFGPRSASEILETCHTTVVLENTEGEQVAMVAFHDYPNIPSIPAWDWYDWLYNLYELDGIYPRNSTFIHLAVWEIIHTGTFMNYVLEFIFGANPQLEYVILIVPPKISNISWLVGHGTRINPIGYSDSSLVQTIVLMLRQHYVRNYKIRRAVEEDNDDLVPMINTYSIRLEQEYGEFYIAEEITRHTDTRRQLIVAEYDGLAVAVLCLNEDVNYKRLNDEFELLPFYGLYKPHVEDARMRDSQSKTTKMNITTESQSPMKRSLKETTSHPLSTYTTSSSSGSSSGGGSEKKSSKSSDLKRPSDAESIDEISLVSIESIKLFVPLEDEAEGEDQGPEEEGVYVSESLSEEDASLETGGAEDKSVSDDGRRPTAYIPYTPHYKGKPNAFTLEIAAAIPSHEIEAFYLLLQAAFECFPDRDYCLLAVPSMLPCFEILNHFVRVAPRPISNYPQELYVLHRNSILSRMTVRKAEPRDIAVVESLATEMLKPAPMLRLFQHIVLEKSFDYQAFVLLTENQVVGVAIVRAVEDLLYLRTNYHLYQWVNQDHFYNEYHGLIKYIVLSPIFQRHARFLLREVHRLSDFEALYYYIYPDDFNTALCTRCLCCVISNLVSVAPRLRPEYEIMNEIDEIDMRHPHQTFGLYVSTPRLSGIPRYEINAQIVVVGASDISISFLKHLIFNNSESYRSNFFNITLVSSEGLYMIKQDDPIRPMFFPQRNPFTSIQMQMLALRTYINVVHGVMTGIDRRKKHITVDYTTAVNYDVLILLCGMQFQKPSAAIVGSEETKEFPRNVYIINCEIDVEMALEHLKGKLHRSMESHDYRPIIVYGYCLEAYCCMAALLKLGIPGNRIVFVEPFPERVQIFEHEVSFFNDGEVDECVAENLLASGITVYPSYYFNEWTMDSRAINVVSVNFESQHNMKTVECSAMFMYNKKTVSMVTFLAINKAGLVFDGAVVIDPQFHTNDPHIYAAGTITKYSRRFYADDMVHKYYNLEEIGQQLAKKIRKMLISQYDEEGGLELTCKQGENAAVPRYEKPIYVHCDLPGNLHYLYITKPGKRVPLEVAMTADTYGDVLITGDSKQLDRQGYFKLHLNQHGSVETITCLAKFITQWYNNTLRQVNQGSLNYRCQDYTLILEKADARDIEWINLVSCWGKHESLLNNLRSRFEVMTVMDLYEYFRQPWAQAIYHDQYFLFNDAINEMMITGKHNNEMIGSIFEVLIEKYKNKDYQPLNADEWEEIIQVFKAVYPREIISMMLEFIVDHHSLLRHYAHPQIVRMLLERTEKSPMFYPQ